MSPRICTSGCGVFFGTTLSLATSASTFGTLASYQKMWPPWSTEMMMFSGLVSRTSTRSLGRTTGIEVVTTGMVIRKMISSTSITSTRGVVLMVEMTSSSSPPDGPTAIDMKSSGTAGRRLRGLPGRAQDHGVEFLAELAHLVHHGLVAPGQPVVAQHRGNRYRQPDRRHDERLAPRARDLVDRSLAGNADRRERVVDAPYGANEADEWRSRSDGGQEGQPALGGGVDAVHGAGNAHGNPLGHRDVALEPPMIGGGLHPRLGDEAVSAVLFQPTGAIADRRGRPELPVDGARMAPHLRLL